MYLYELTDYMHSHVFISIFLTFLYCAVPISIVLISFDHLRSIYVTSACTYESCVVMLLGLRE